MFLLIIEIIASLHWLFCLAFLDLRSTCLSFRRDVLYVFAARTRAFEIAYIVLLGLARRLSQSTCHLYSMNLLVFLLLPSYFMVNSVYLPTYKLKSLA